MTTGSSKRAAESLAQSIKDYWARRGCHPRVWLERKVIQDLHSHWDVIWVVRSDMRGGKPRSLRAPRNQPDARGGRYGARMESLSRGRAPSQSAE